MHCTTPTITVKVSDYYNRPDYYRYMSQALFFALEKAFLEGLIMAKIPEIDFIEMTHKHIVANGCENN